MHGGGSCQFAVSYDQGKNFAVIASVMGGCPIDLAYDIPIPSTLPAGKKALFAWSWFNQLGNRYVLSPHLALRPPSLHLVSFAG